MSLLRRLEEKDLDRASGDVVPPEALEIAREIVNDVRAGGEPALRRHAERLGDVEPDGRLFYDRDALLAALDALDTEARERLERVASRVRVFAEAQRAAILDVEIPVPGGAAGHRVTPVERAGCYAPGGRYPLPSSVLMTAVTARAAGVETVWVASPRPQPITLAAAAVAGADGLLAAGGAQAIAALAFGAGPLPAGDVVVGPGNVYVTAAKQLVAGRVGIDMLAGPSELVILADASGDPALIAADLLAQAEHDDDAVPILVTTVPSLITAVERELARQLETLPTAATARLALKNGGYFLAASREESIRACDRLAPEHLELHLADADAVADRFRHFGALFIGAASGEVLGDYGAGPNHTLPTGGTARYAAGLSVMTFLRLQTWLRIDDPLAAAPLAEDAAWFGRAEGLEAHARSAEMRRRQPGA
jgi:histidinol dehydrogenase